MLFDVMIDFLGDRCIFLKFEIANLAFTISTVIGRQINRVFSFFNIFHCFSPLNFVFRITERKSHVFLFWIVMISSMKSVISFLLKNWIISSATILCFCEISENELRLLLVKLIMMSL